MENVMAKKHKKKLKIKNLLIIVVLVVFIIIILPKSKEEDEVVKVDLHTMTKEEIKAYGDENNIKVNTNYEYSTTISKDKVISVKEDNNVINLVLSKGDYDDSYFRDKKVNEMGKVPIMMYHGIIDTEDNQYTGGNVDKNGYKRTAKAFREDLEFYYKNGYRMIRLEDYIHGKIDVPIGYSPIILTFDDGDADNCKVLGKNSDGSLQIDPNSAVGILEEFKKKYPDFGVTATFFVMSGIFNQSQYNKDIVNFMINNGYDIGNHTISHPDFTKISEEQSVKEVGKMYKTLDSYLGDKYVKIIALPFGSPYKKEHANYKHILSGTYDGYEYKTEAALRVGWEPELSPYSKNFDPTFLKRCRAYDNNGKEFDIEMVFKNLEKNRYISDGDIDRITVPSKEKDNISSEYTNIRTYEEV
jgi:peptidoglycan/xylan/chitin deacetylase (PgdA/CDA1 family)